MATSLIVHVWNFKLNLKFPPSSSHMLSTISIKSIKTFFFPSPHCFFLHSLPKTLYALSAEPGLKLSLTSPHGRLTLCCLLSDVRVFCSVNVHCLLQTVAASIKCFYSNDSPLPSCGLKKVLQTSEWFMISYVNLCIQTIFPFVFPVYLSLTPFCHFSVSSSLR